MNNSKTKLATGHLSFFFSSRRRHTSLVGDWSSDVCSSDLPQPVVRHERRRSHVPRLPGDRRPLAARQLRRGAAQREHRGGHRGGRVVPRDRHHHRGRAELRAALAGLIVALALAPVVGAQRAPRAMERWDPVFRKYSKRFFGPAYDWRVFKAQALVESGLDSAATSRVGARGIMQLLPSTFAQIQSKNPEFTSLDAPEWNIAAGIKHARGLWVAWRGQVASEDRRSFMFGSYNAGRVPILRARAVAAARAYDPRLWSSVAAVAPEVPGWRHRETLTYLERITANLRRMDERGRLTRSSRAGHLVIGEHR